MKLKEHLQETVFEDFSLVGLKAGIILIGLLLIFLAISINNKWVLSGVFAWSVL